MRGGRPIRHGTAAGRKCAGSVVPASEVGRLIGWSGDGRTLFSFVTGAAAGRPGLDLASGRVSVVRELKIPDPTGVWRVGLSSSLTIVASSPTP